MIDLVIILLAIFSTVFTVYKYDKDKKNNKRTFTYKFFRILSKILGFLAFFDFMGADEMINKSKNNKDQK